MAEIRLITGQSDLKRQSLNSHNSNLLRTDPSNHLEYLSNHILPYATIQYELVTVAAPLNIKLVNHFQHSDLSICILVQACSLHEKNPYILSKDRKEFVDSHASGGRTAVGGQRAIGALHLCQPERTEIQSSVRSI